MIKKALLVIALTTPLCTHAQTESSTGNIDAAVTKLKARIAKTMLETGVPGLAVAVVYKGETKFIHGYG